MAEDFIMWRGTCKDEMCRQPLLFREFENYVCCYYCGQTHDTGTLDNTSPLEATPESFRTFLNSTIQRIIQRVSDFPPRGPDLVKVMGYSHYHQKLVSHLLTTYGMDKHTGKARPLRQLTGRTTLDCSVFGDRTFHIETKHIHISGFGKDNAAAEYLAEILDLVKPYNDDKDSLVPLYTDGDGHCLVHAVSRALVGRELFWYPLRIGLKQHFNLNIEKYKALLGNFINSSEWPCIIDECEPDYKPPDGSMVGLRNVHIFGLANLLRRPIILLDCMAGMKASADYAAVFLPGLNPPMACSNKTGQFNPPICLAWSSPARNHYIPLVPVKEYLLPKFPRSLLPKVWGFPQSLMESYIRFDDQNCLTIGGENSLTQQYICKLTTAMDEQFQARNNVPPSVVTDLFHYHYSTKLATPPKPEAVIEVASATFRERRLLRCLSCNALCVVPLSSHWLRPGGLLYSAARKVFGFLKEDYEYPFLNYGVTCKYNTMQNMLVVNTFDPSLPCSFCQGTVLRKIRSDGSIAYVNSDVTSTPVIELKRCKCGFKHYWDGQEYDNPPVLIPLTLNWNSKTEQETVPWFQDESDPKLNSNVYDVASSVVQKHFPGEFGSEQLHSTIVEQLLEMTKDIYSLKQYEVEESLGSVFGNLLSNEDSMDGECRPRMMKRGPSSPSSDDGVSSKRMNSSSPGPSTSQLS